MKTLTFSDSIYGEISVDEDLSSLVMVPVLQRLRHVRLSNIDSLNMPGIANLSRFDHALGVGHLATRIGMYNGLSREDRLALSASALLHDWAITPFGHLVEEAFQYLDIEKGFDHEHRLYEIVIGEGLEEIGGINRQILYGRQANIKPWAQRMVGTDNADEWLFQITEFIQGRGRFGRLICGDIDLDNIDGVFRMAYHMGLPIDRECPLRLAKAVVDVVRPNGWPVFQNSARADIAHWVTTRQDVYGRLMLADLDFVDKLMILYATVSAIESGEIENLDWGLIDDQLLERLLSSSKEEIRDTTKRWRVGELWDVTPLYWMHGRRPDFSEVRAFSESLSAELCRPCFAYAIKDKRNRLLNIRFDDGTENQLGTESMQWLIGVGSPARKRFKKSDIKTITQFAESHFHTSVIAIADTPWSKIQDRDEEECLL